MARSPASSLLRRSPAPADWHAAARPLKHAAQELRAQPLRPSKVVMILLVWALATAALPLAG